MRLCEDRLQQKNESFTIYLAEMERLFQSLSYTVPESQKLAILRRNMKSSYKNKKSRNLKIIQKNQEI
jgi:hypothetical protein